MNIIVVRTRAVTDQAAIKDHPLPRKVAKFKFFRVRLDNIEYDRSDGYAPASRLAKNGVCRSAAQ